MMTFGGEIDVWSGKRGAVYLPCVAEMLTKQNTQNHPT